MALVIMLALVGPFAGLPALAVWMFDPNAHFGRAQSRARRHNRHTA